MMLKRFYPLLFSIIQCYAPINDTEEETNDTFYQQLQKALDNVPLHDVLLVIEDLNAKVGRSNERREKIKGKMVVVRCRVVG